jgi:hypothetical protein
MESHQALAVEPVHGGGAGASMSAAAQVFKAVAHPVRAHILELLFRCESSHLSPHLTQMRGQLLIQCRWNPIVLACTCLDCEARALKNQRWLCDSDVHADPVLTQTATVTPP